MRLGLWSVLAACAALVARPAPGFAQVSNEVVADLATIGAAQPQGGLIAGPDGAFYGTASRGGASDCGLVYRLDGSGMLTALHAFDGVDGCEPSGELVIGPGGALYGVTRRGGDPSPTLGGGTIYRLALDGAHTVLHRFILDLASPTPWAIPANPAAALLLHPDGFFYGTTLSGDIFQVAPDGSTFQVIEGFGAPDEPEILDSPLVLGADGFVYGVSSRVLAIVAPSSVVFRVTLAGATEVFRFRRLRPPPGVPPAPQGLDPRGLVVGSDGAFYGVTAGGGPSYTDGSTDRGTVFRLSLDGALTTLHTFSSLADPLIGGPEFFRGALPRGNLVRGRDGYLYGTTSAGGHSDLGTLFRISETGAFTLLFAFATAGYAPADAPLLEATPGTFYGVLASASGGLLYRFSPFDNLWAEDRLVGAAEGVPISGQVTVAGAGSAPVTFSLFANGSRGVATLSPTGAFTYTATVDAGLIGRDTFTFVASAGGRTSNVGIVTVLVQAVNDAPVAVDASFATTAGAPLNGTLRATDPEGRPLFYAVESQPTQGAVVVDSSTGQFTYTPGPSAAGQDAFTFRAHEFLEQGTSNSSNVATVTISLGAAAPTVVLTMPAGGERVFIGVPVQVAWTAAAADAIDVDLSSDGGQTFAPIAECSGLAGTAAGCVWTPQGPATSTAQLRVTARNASGTAATIVSGPFTIARGRPRLAVVAPPARTTLTMGTTQAIWWTHNLGAGAFVRIELSRDGGATWEVLATAVRNLTDVTGAFDWLLTGPATRQGRLRVTSLLTGASDTGRRLLIVD